MKITFLGSGDINNDARYFFMIGKALSYLQTPSKTTCGVAPRIAGKAEADMTWHTYIHRALDIDYANTIILFSFSLSVYATLSTGNCQMARCKSCREAVWKCNMWHDGTSIDKQCPILFYPPSPVSDNVCELRMKGTERIDDVLAWQISSQTHLLHATQVVMLSISESFVYLPHIT